ncbi:MAG: 3-deoxy-manno-octulosonate cytidylyltransferase [Gammaproteobacteria bacterium]|nr:3-deoxy-manno-octulosonate cytidylyltransferase [Gammaproteobacteria bacterium]
MSTIGIIPARMASSRFPGKPLALIHGVPMIGHVYFRCKMSRALDEVYIATCDEEIRQYARSIGAPCVMTANTHERATDRTAEAMLKIEADTGKRTDIVVMIQGDEPMTRPEMIDEAIAPFRTDRNINVVNLMAHIDNVEDFEDPNEVKVVIDLKGDALYFSREAIPSRKKGVTKVPMLKQVCIIPFRRDYLLRFNSLSPTPLEVIESVDMMRILEHGEKVRMIMTNAQTVSVDTPEDHAYVNELMRTDSLMPSYSNKRTG